jgi:pimeloyl-ACP methyl ester carboxylesterase
MREQVPLRALAGCILVAAALLFTSTAGAKTPVRYAPVNAPGPGLTVPAAQLSQALVCSGNLAGSGHEPILLVPGTTLNPTTDFSWNWEPALDAQDWPYCTINLPGNGMANIETAAQYVVAAIRTMHALSGTKIDIVGHSQGGMIPRWALRFWPDTRAMVDHVVGLSPSNHGTLDAVAICAVTCAPSFWQQASNSKFIAALNSGAETFAGISYTNIYTNTDEVVVPNFGPAASSALHTGSGQITNVAIQQVCPLDVTEHLGIGTYDNTAYQIAMEALTHSGSGNPALVPTSTCLQPLMPGVDPLTFATNEANLVATVATTLATYPHVAAEPALACYVTASCRTATTPAKAGVSSKPKVAVRLGVSARRR